MPYEVREEEKKFWSKSTWSVKEKADGEVKRVEKPVKELPVGYVKNILKFIKHRYNKMYYETYIEGSKLWTELNLVASTNPLDEYYKNNPKVEPTAQAANNDNKVSAAAMQQPVPDSEIISHKQDFAILLNLITSEIDGIDNGTIKLEEVRDFLAGVKIRINALASKIN